MQEEGETRIVGEGVDGVLANEQTLDELCERIELRFSFVMAVAFLFINSG